MISVVAATSLLLQATHLETASFQRLNECQQMTMAAGFLTRLIGDTEQQARWNSASDLIGSQMLEMAFPRSRRQEADVTAIMVFSNNLAEASYRLVRSTMDEEDQETRRAALDRIFRGSEICENELLRSTDARYPEVGTDIE